jgi:undecaprenyl-diphosphatase
MKLRTLPSITSPLPFLLGSFLFGVLFFAASFRLAEVLFPNVLASLDSTVFRWFAGLRPEDGKGIFLAITRLGNTTCLVVVVSRVSLSLVVWRRNFEAALFGSGIGLATLSMVAIKWLIGRPCPASPAVSVLDGNPAFPSGHVAVGGVVYILFAYLLARELHSRLSRLMLLGFGIVVALLIAWTRLYFGVHWMSDVLGGIALAGFWLAVLVFLIVSHRRLHPFGLLLPLFGKFFCKPSFLSFWLSFVSDMFVRDS